MSDCVCVCVYVCVCECVRVRVCACVPIYYLIISSSTRDHLLVRLHFYSASIGLGCRIVVNTDQIL